MIEIPVRQLAPGQRDQLQRQASLEDLAETLVRQEYSLDPPPDGPDWYDGVANSGAKYEVKSTSTEVGDRYPADGRFRLWRGQHRSLTVSEGQGMAWYAFVLLDERDGTVKIQRRRPTTITRIVRERGGWNRSGHEEQGRQHKLPYRLVVP